MNTNYYSRITSHVARQMGFTLVELLVAMGVMALLLGITSMNLIRPQRKASLDAITDGLLSDLRAQQANAMNGKTDTNYGIRIQSGNYILFRGTFTAGDAANVTVNTSSVTVSTTFPSSTVIFTKLSGDVSGFSSGNNRITISNGSQSKVIDINRYGVPSVQ